MGSPFRLVFYAQDDRLARKAADSVFRRISYLNDVMSDYRDGSEINRLSALAGGREWVRVSPELYDILYKARQLSIETEGAFDITVGAAVRMWRSQMLRREFPSRKTIRAARKNIGYKYLEFDPDARLVRLRRKGVKLDVGGIGKGYAADEGIRILSGMGITSALVDAGGDFALSNPPPGSKGWKISVSSGPETDSSRVLHLSDCGVATSGATYRFIEHRGKRYSHILNPAAGTGLLHHLRSTVIAPDGTRADALATAISVLGIKKSQQLLSRFPELKVWLIEMGDEHAEAWDTLPGK